MEVLTGNNWKEFFKAPLVVLILGRKDCKACEKWNEKLATYEIPNGLRIGKILLDSPGFGRFKIEHEWVSNVDMLPFNVIFLDGEMKTSWAGSSLKKLQKKLDSFV